MPFGLLDLGDDCQSPYCHVEHETPFILKITCHEHADVKPMWPLQWNIPLCINNSLIRWHKRTSAMKVVYMMTEWHLDAFLLYLHCAWVTMLPEYHIFQAEITPPVPK